MPGTTSIYGLPYQDPDDPPNGPNLGQALAEAVEAELQRIDSKPQPASAYLETNETSNSATYVPGTTNGTSFTAPQSGKVYVSVSGGLGTNSLVALVGAWLSFEVRSGGTVGSGSVVLAADDSRSSGPFRPNSSETGFKYAPASVRILVTGLTPGNTYNARSMFRSDNISAQAGVHHRNIVVEPVL